MKIYELKYELPKEQLKTLLFLTGYNRILKASELSDSELWNLQEFFGYNNTNKHILKVIIYRDKVVTKIKEI